MSRRRCRRRVERVDLAAHRRTAVDGSDLHPHRLTQGHQRVGDLLGSSRVGTSTRPRGVSARGGVGARVQPGQHRKAEREGLAGAGLGATEDVPACDRVGERAGLDRERQLNPAARELADEGRSGRPEVGEAAGGGRGLGERGGQEPVELGGIAGRSTGRFWEIGELGCGGTAPWIAAACGRPGADGEKACGDSLVTGRHAGVVCSVSRGKAASWWTYDRGAAGGRHHEALTQATARARLARGRWRRRGRRRKGKGNSDGGCCPATAVGRARRRRQ